MPPTNERHIENANFSLVATHFNYRDSRKSFYLLFVILRRSISTKIIKKYKDINPLQNVSYLKISKCIAVRILAFS